MRSKAHENYYRWGGTASPTQKLSWEPWEMVLFLMGPSFLESTIREDAQGLSAAPQTVSPLMEGSLKRHLAGSVQLADTGPFGTIHQVQLSARDEPNPRRMHFPFVWYM